MNIGDIVVLKKDSVYYDRQNFNLNKKTRIFEIIKRVEQVDILNFECVCIRDGYRNYYSSSDLDIYDPEKIEKYNRRKLKI